jgi:hypothetical protein
VKSSEGHSSASSQVSAEAWNGAFANPRRRTVNWTGPGPDAPRPGRLVKSCVDLRADPVQPLGPIVVGFLFGHKTRQSLCVDLATWNPPTTGVLFSRVEDPVGDRNGGASRLTEGNSYYLPRRRLGRGLGRFHLAT